MMAEKKSARKDEKSHKDDLLDEALSETFPASDPPAMTEPSPHAKDKAPERRAPRRQRKPPSQ